MQELIDFIAHDAYRLECRRRASPCVDWCYLKEETRKKLVKNAQNRVNTWLWKTRAQRRDISMTRNAQRLRTLVTTTAQKIVSEMKRTPEGNSPKSLRNVEQAIDKAIAAVLAIQP
jgi:hypothetical protein